MDGYTCHMVVGLVLVMVAVIELIENIFLFSKLLHIVQEHAYINQFRAYIQYSITPTFTL